MKQIGYRNQDVTTRYEVILPVYKNIIRVYIMT